MYKNQSIHDQSITYKTEKKNDFKKNISQRTVMHFTISQYIHIANSCSPIPSSKNSCL